MRLYRNFSLALSTLIIGGFCILRSNDFVDDLVTPPLLIYQITLQGWIFIGCCVLLFVINMKLMDWEDATKDREKNDINTKLTNIETALKNRGMEYDPESKTINIHSQGGVSIFTGPQLTDARLNEISQEIKSRLDVVNSKVHILLGTGSNCGQFALQLYDKLENMGYDLEPIDSLLFMAPIRGITYAVHEGRVRVILGVVDP